MNLKRLRNPASFLPRAEPRQAPGLRQCGAALLAALLASGCGGPGDADFGSDTIKNFSGAVAADEPRAALVGRDVLAGGGSAADAAAATYFALAVTYPQAAGLGGGGVCTVYTPKLNKAESLEFYARPARQGGAVAVPGNPRGFAALQARYGRFRWPSVVAPAETIANFGASLTRASVRALESLDASDLAKPAAADFTRLGRVAPEGELIKLPDLGLTLSRLRTGGVNELYSGALTRAFLEGVQAAGGNISADELRSFAPAWREAPQFPVDSTTFAVQPGPGGDIVRKIWQASVTPGLRLIGSASFARERLPAAISEAYEGARFGAAGPVAATSFAAIDADGLAVACSVTMQRPFGAGSLAGNTGIALGAPPSAESDETRAFATMVAFNSVNKQAFMAAAASGGAPAPAALAQVVANAAIGGRSLDQALNEPRSFRDGATLRSEATGSAAQSAEAPALGRVNILYCANGVPRAPETCRAAADPRGFGIGQLTGK